MRPTSLVPTAAIVLGVLLATPSSAEEKHGVAVYPGAKLDEQTGAILKKDMNLDATCYRSGDAVAKITAFYEKQPGFKVVGEATKESSLLEKPGVNVTVQRPWLDMKSGQVQKDTTLISIVKTKSR
jgi:hypothetical protein